MFKWLAVNINIVSFYISRIMDFLIIGKGFKYILSTINNRNKSMPMLICEIVDNPYIIKFYSDSLI